MEEEEEEEEEEGGGQEEGEGAMGDEVGDVINRSVCRYNRQV